MQQVRIGISIVALTGIIVSLAGCTRSAQENAEPIVRFYLKDDVKSLDPANAYDSVSLDVLPHMSETLYQYDPVAKEFKLIPLLAADLPTFSKDRLTVTIPLKRGVMFTDDACFKSSDGKGRELKAQDFVYAIKRLTHPGVQSNGAWIFENKMVGFSELLKKLRDAKPAEAKKIFDESSLAGAVAKDDYTLELKLTKPYPQLMYMLAMSFTAPIAKEVVDACADERGQLNDTMVGTGPFKLDHWNRGNEVVLKKNPTFRHDVVPAGFGTDTGKVYPFLDEIVFQVIKEEQPMWLNFQQGSLDIGRIPKDNFSATIAGDGKLSPDMRKKGIEVDVAAGPVMYWLNFNVKDKVLSNKFLRQALSSAVDRDKWVELFVKGRGHKQVTAAPTGLQDRPSEATLKYDFDVTRAKDLLAKAGFPDGKGLPTLALDMRGADSVNRQIGEFLTNQFASIGVKLNVIYNTFPAFLEKSKNGAFQVSMGGWFLDYPDVENVYQLLYGKNVAPGPNDSNFDNVKFNQLYEKMVTLDPGPARASIIQEMDAIVQEEAPWAMGYYRDEFTLRHGWVKNFVANPFFRDFLKYVRIDQDMKKKMQAALR